MVQRHLIALTAALLSAAALAVPASAGGQVSARGDLIVTDRRGDGPADIVRMTVEHSRVAAAVVRVKVRGVRTRGPYMALQLYVDPYGKGQRPSYAIALGLNADGEYSHFRTRGWHNRPRRTLDCGERARLLERPHRVRVVKFRFPYACFGDFGAKFAVRAERYRNGSWHTTDWSPRARTLSRTFRL
jgi:hypothetical protein